MFLPLLQTYYSSANGREEEETIEFLGELGDWFQEKLEAQAAADRTQQRQLSQHCWRQTDAAVETLKYRRIYRRLTFAPTIVVITIPEAREFALHLLFACLDICGARHL